MQIMDLLDEALEPSMIIAEKSALAMRYRRCYALRVISTFFFIIFDFLHKYSSYMLNYFSFLRLGKII